MRFPEFNNSRKTREVITVLRLNKFSIKTESAIFIFNLYSIYKHWRTKLHHLQFSELPLCNNSSLQKTEYPSFTGVTGVHCTQKCNYIWP
jgi:hypothetical protein